MLIYVHFDKSHTLYLTNVVFGLCWFFQFDVDKYETMGGNDVEFNDMSNYYWVILNCCPRLAST